MYIARHYIKDAGHLYVPGEEIPESIGSDKLEGLLKKGAIVEASAPKPVRIEQPEPEPEPEPAEDIEIDVMAGVVQEEAPKKAARSKRKGKEA